MAGFGELLHSIGEFGRFQKITLFALCFPNVIVPLHFASVYFTQSDPERHCNTDWILRAHPNLTAEEQLNLTVPRGADGALSRCRMFVPVDRDIGSIRRFGLNETEPCTDGWVYGSTLYVATIVTDFDLVCDQAHLLQVAQTVLMAGILVGCLLFGPFAESFGRKRATQVPVVLMFVFSGASGLCPSFYLYLASQFLVGIGYGGYRLNAVILATEWIGVSQRSWGSCVTQLCGALGQCVLAGMIYFIRNWRVAQLVTAALHGVITIYIWCILESARWLLGRGKTGEAKRLITKVAAINNCTIPEGLLEKIDENEKEKKEGAIALIKSPVLRKNFFTISLAWFSLNLTYFSLSLNVANFGMSVFLTQLIFGLSEVPAHILSIWLLEVLGRRVSLVATLLIGGLSVLAVLAVPQGYAVTVTTLVTAGRIFLNWAGSVCSVYLQELFPTSFRQTASGLGSIMSRIGGLMSPLVNLLGIYHPAIPTIIFSSLSIISGSLCFLLPETRRKELPESILDAESNGYTRQTNMDEPTGSKSSKMQTSC
ncbi:solute carrier family 22 member 13-like [Takifugu flavidus]|uniref:Major facilitator superfamily (MFS) profile domain-containing protein n=1 Tax=Takifugu bimaculatus TaxID=433685 RepID=A0A4Z2C0V9_9TELE|nr:solute carrier family 22 member 13-like [Takifugu flavidus]TNM98069.1 hypothetical protein fugu_014315 [Takifugu bimaculatus]